VDESDSIRLKTSGSTGIPKNMEVKKSAMIFSAKQSSDYFQFLKNEKWLLCIPASFIGGQMILVRAMMNEVEVFAVDPKIELHLENEYDFASMIPMQVEKFIHSSHRIKKILVGGASIPLKLESELKKINHTNFFASYGMTETVSHIALRKVNGEGNSEYFSGFKNILLGTDDRGCLTIYHKNYCENVLVTNDLVEFDSHSRFKVIGRADNIINSGGLKIIPEELERKISEIIPQRIMVIGVPDESTGEKPILLIEGEKFNPSTLLILQNHLAENFSKNISPKGVIFIERFTETANGKIDRKQTKENYLMNLRTNL
jgi:O-succinylbenzoic acid--CoA ligase